MGDDCWTPCETDLESSSTKIDSKVPKVKIDVKNLKRKLTKVVV